MPTSDLQPPPGPSGYTQPSQAYSGAQIASAVPGVSLGAPVPVAVDIAPDPAFNHEDDPVLGKDDGWD